MFEFDPDQLIYLDQSSLLQCLEKNPIHENPHLKYDTDELSDQDSEYLQEESEEHPKERKETKQSSVHTKSYSIGMKCLKIMGLSRLFNLWKPHRDKFRKNKATICLFLLIVHNENQAFLSQFIRLYEAIVNQILFTGKIEYGSKIFLKWKSSKNFPDTKNFLMATVRAIKRFMETKKVDNSLDILYSKKSETEKKNSVEYLKIQADLISKGHHKNLKQ